MACKLPIPSSGWQGLTPEAVPEEISSVLELFAGVGLAEATSLGPLRADGFLCGGVAGAAPVEFKLSLPRGGCSWRVKCRFPPRDGKGSCLPEAVPDEIPSVFELFAGVGSLGPLRADDLLCGGVAGAATPVDFTLLHGCLPRFGCSWRAISGNS